MSVQKLPLPLLHNVVDAVARGRLALAELVGLTEAELDAIYMLAVTRMDMQRNAEAHVLLAGLLTLFPYQATYWQAYGIALHRLHMHQAAKQAYDVALLLAPHHLPTTGHRGEMQLYLGNKAAAQADLQAACASSDNNVAQRAQALLQRLALAQDAVAEPPSITQDTTTFVLADSTPLPLEDGPLAQSDAAFLASEADEITRTHVRSPAAVTLQTQEPTQAAAAPLEITHTAIVRRRQGGRVDEEL